MCMWSMFVSVFVKEPEGPFAEKCSPISDEDHIRDIVITFDYVHSLLSKLKLKGLTAYISTS